MAPKVAAKQGKPVAVAQGKPVVAAKGKPIDLPAKEEDEAEEESDASSSEEEDEEENDPDAEIDEEKSKEEEKDKTKAPETERSPTSKADEAQETQCQIILTNIGKKGKFDITTKSGLESFQSFLTSCVKHRLNNDQNRSIWEAGISTEHQRTLKFIILELIRNHNNTFGSEEEDFLNWAYGGWCDGGRYTASISQMLNFVTTSLLPRANNHQKLVEPPLAIQRKEQSNLVAKAICDPTLLVGMRNANSQSATSSIEELMGGYEINLRLKAFIEKEDERQKSLDELWDLIKDKAKGNQYAKGLVEFLRKKDVVLKDLDDFTTLLLEWMAETRNAADVLRNALQISTTEFMKILAKLTDPKVRHLLVAGALDKGGGNPSNTHDHPKGGGGSREKVKTGTKSQDAPGEIKPKHDHSKERPREQCKACGIMVEVGKHGVDGAGCTYKKNDHPNHNPGSKSWPESEAGKAAKRQGKDCLEWEKTITGEDFKMARGKAFKKRGWETANPTPTEGTSQNLRRFICGLAEMEGIKPTSTGTISKKDINPFLTMKIVNLCNNNSREGQRQDQQVSKEIKGALVDTGAIDANYISRRLVRVLEKSYGLVRETEIREIKTPDKSAAKFFTEGRVDLSVRLFNELTRTEETIKISALVIDSPIDLILGLPTIREHNLLLKCTNQILWGTRDKWIDDPTVTPSAFKKADANMLNSIVDALMEIQGDDDDDDEPAESPRKKVVTFSGVGPTQKSKRKKDLVNCSGCNSLVSHEECKTNASSRQSKGGNGEGSRQFSRQASPPQECPNPDEFPNWKPFDIIPRECLNLCLLCSNAEVRHLDRLLTESDEFFSATMSVPEVLDDTRRMLYQLQAKVHSTIADAQREPSGEGKTAWQGASSGESKDQCPMQVDSDENPTDENPEMEDNDHHNRWSGLIAAISSGVIGSPSTSKKAPPPIVNPLPGIKPGDRIPKERLLPSDGDEPEADNNVWINDPAGDPTYASKEWIEESEEWKECAVHGSGALQREIRALLKKYKGVFSSKLPTQPARVKPLAFQVDETKWKLPCNREPPRRQSLTKDSEIRDQIREMILSGVVSTSKADAWSQVLLTPKPNGKWRFCIDYRQLNKLIENRGWPLPRIQELITRVGNAKPIVFGKMDLTNGYHQMPLAKESRKYTAFRSASGLHESNRVPMGLKNAGAYFQQAMADEVVGDILYNGAELYIDDILIHATSDEEFLKRLEIILKRCLEKGIVLAPKKCAFGMEETEILGHTINNEGSTFSKEKLQGVLDFKLPTTSVQLQSFLGLGNYFRDHVRDVADMERPLRDMVKASKGKHAQLHWTKTDKTAFDTLKNAVWNCPKLFFWQPHLPVFLHTDACNTGIGAYLFQVDENGKELPIGFLSRALKGAELNWSTFEQEGYAIHEALKKFEYLLRDIKFTLRTDHRNLLYMNMKASDKVLRWKLDIQQFDFDVEHIPGPDNIVADLYSRLCSVTTNDYSIDKDNVDDEEKFLENIREKMETSEQRPSSFLAALHNRFKPAPATRIERPMDTKVYNWLKKCHGHESLHGHRGVDATLTLLKASVPPAEHWTGMRKDARDFVKQCPCCQFMQSSKTLIATTAPYNVSVRAPMDRLNIDTIGPLPPDENGNAYIIVIVDVFSRFVELYPAPDATALSAAKALIQWIGRYGNPGEILSDNGAQYTADIITQLCELIQVEHLTILPYSHEENAIVERANREVNRHLRAIVFDKKVKKEWSLFLPLVQRIMNATVSASTGVTPASIIFGNAVDLDKGLLPYALKSAIVYEEGKPLNEYLSKLLTNQAHIIALAQETQYIINQEHIRRKTDKGNQVTGYDINDYVIYEYPQSLLVGDSRPDKLAMHYRGPYRIIKIDGSRIEIQNLVNTQTTEAHISQLRPFLYDPNYVNPVEVARNAGEEFEVDSIVEIRGKRNAQRRYKRTDLEVRVHWLGYNDRYDTWEPFSEMKFSDKFQQYCWDNNYKYLLIPEALERLSG